jgi:hypothetical protein
MEKKGATQSKITIAKSDATRANRRDLKSLMALQCNAWT